MPLFFVWLSDGAVLLRHGEAGVHRRLQRLSGAAGCCCADPVALQVRTVQSGHAVGQDVGIYRFVVLFTVWLYQKRFYPGNHGN